MSEPLILPLSSATLVFGLDWMPLIGKKPEQLARRMARQHRATHMVLPKDTLAAVGLIALKSARRPAKKRLHSAAQNVAQMFANGTVAMVLELEQAGCWLVAVHDGAVVARTDKLYQSRHEAMSVLAELRQAYPHIVVLGGAQAPECPQLAEIEALSNIQSCLSPIRHWRISLPKPIQGFVLALILVVLVPRLWRTWESGRRIQAMPVPIDAAKAWQEAVKKSADMLFVHGEQGTRELLDVLYELPVRLAGWDLLQAECAPASSQWQCQARYERRDKGTTNEQLLSRAPAHWSIEFLSMDLARPVWTQAIHRSAVAHHALKAPQHTERHLFSSLQAIRAVYTRMQFGKPQPLPVSAPADQHGQTLARPAGQPLYLSRSVHIDGPLRSGSLLLPHTGSMAWKKVVLSLRDASAQGVLSSRVSVSFEGVLYETDVAAN